MRFYRERATFWEIRTSSQFETKFLVNIWHNFYMFRIGVKLVNFTWLGISLPFIDRETVTLYPLTLLNFELCQKIWNQKKIFTHNVGSWAGEVSHVEVGEEAEGGGSRPVDAPARVSPAGAEYLKHVIITNNGQLWWGIIGNKDWQLETTDFNTWTIEHIKIAHKEPSHIIPFKQSWFFTHLCCHLSRGLKKSWN